MEVVSALRSALAKHVGQNRYDLWFGRTARLELGDGTLTIFVPSRFYQEWISTNFRRHVESACLETLGKPLLLQFTIAADGTLPATPTAGDALENKPVAPSIAALPAGAASQNAVTVYRQQPAPGSSDGAAVAAGMRTPTSTTAQTSPARRHLADFASFMDGDSNRLARVASQMVVANPGQISPLVIQGPTSVGKTHLLEAIYTEARSQPRRMSALLLTAEQFTTAFLEALRGNGLPSFRAKYRGVDLLLIDDLQFFCGKRATQVELLYTIDALAKERRQLVFACDRPPAEMPELGPELMTRLQSGMVCRVEPPDYATRLAIVAEVARRVGVVLSQEVAAFVASRLTRHPRELCGAVCRLRASAVAAQRPIDLALAEEALAELIRDGKQPVRLADIDKAVSDLLGLEPGTLRSLDKTRHVSGPRMLAMWLARKHTRAALTEIGHYFGRRSHSTVVSAQKRVEGWLADGQPLQLADRLVAPEDALREIEHRLRAG